MANVYRTQDHIKLYPRKYLYYFQKLLITTTRTLIPFPKTNKKNKPHSIWVNGENGIIIQTTEWQRNKLGTQYFCTHNPEKISIIKTCHKTNNNAGCYVNQMIQLNIRHCCMKSFILSFYTIKYYTNYFTANYTWGIICANQWEYRNI